MRKGYIHINTGDGKGKTTAALGLSIRTLISGGKVFFGQFIKKGNTAELSVPDYFENFTIEQFGEGFLLGRVPDDNDIRSAEEGLKKVAGILKGGEYDLVVMDEVNVAISKGLIKVEDVLSALDSKAGHVEVIMTGRNAPEELIERADLVTEMRKVKHYYDKGVKGREGIEY
ncbi:cob(I)yrinic acid a,c-diamide adenosyltransferase [Methanoplanus endosymbiosus]|uniref:Cob(I)yrinic acid a,c-diamide adenosyltransferase n=1 Tax=Methanoplanus endosymbiosus TaxID=33865 RepID=A0A9E7PN15_9EURY|nr:cob(I)yrinic acid a,c-diamide adenosyltransferase [Methanoplanus endosymbiosus]UUX93273.1 cob(I)yrinic acid a,c-diamide adenosyltransferase [Methanoplanus endosymbiosus]